jgi:Ca-activated chloride channel family protein
VPDRVAERPSDDLTFAAAVAAFGMLLRESEHRGGATIRDVIAMATRARGADREGYRADFIRLAGAYSELVGAEKAPGGGR